MFKPYPLLVSVAVTASMASGAFAVPAKAPEVRQNADLTYYVAPSGNDALSGQSTAEAVRTLGRIQDLLKARVLKENERQIAVKFLPGTYRGLEVTWDFYQPGRTIVFEPQDYKPGKRTVVIDGQASDAEQFFLLRLTTPAPDAEPIATGIVVRGLSITNYCEAISLGDWKSKANVTGNLIEDNQFTRIGSKYQTAKVQDNGRKVPTGACVAAIRLQQASGNFVRRNTFQDIENLPASRTGVAKYGPLLLHSIYLSKNSSDNLIEANRFERFSGSPVRIRAQSDNNRIIDNSFAAPVYPAKVPDNYRIKAVSQWYCNDAVQVCKDRAEEGNAECPSVGTEIVGNQTQGDLELYADESQSKTATCTVRNARGASSTEPRLERNTQRR